LKLILIRYMFQITVLAISLLKIAYAVSRPLFYSGPDANGYMPAALAFAELGYLSKEIPFLPIYPPGYPIALSILIRIFQDNWIYAAQVVQILIFALGTILVREMLNSYFTKIIGNISAFLLILSPAWFVANGEAMYETLLFFYISASLYFFLRGKISSRGTFLNPILGSFFSVLAISTHPRVLIIYVILFLTYIYNSRKALKESTMVIWISICINFLGIILLGYLSVVRTGIFTLSSALWPSMTNNSVLGGCTDFQCVVLKIFGSPFDFLLESLSNFAAFWSPHSGSLARGSWFHNISLLAQLEKYQLTLISIIIGILFTFIVIGSWVFGTFQLWRTNRNCAFMFTFLTSLSFLLTDILVYGDNRHRLIALIFMIPAHGVTTASVIRKYKPKLLRYLRDEAVIA